ARQRSGRGAPPVSAAALLARVLWISDFEVSAPAGPRQAAWVPGRLSELAPIGAEAPLAPGARRAVGTVVPTSSPALWWCDGTGAVLADGIWSGQDLFGAVVNLTGPHVPRLTLDRRHIVHHDAAEVRRILHAGIPALLAGGTALRSLPWLGKLAAQDPDLADGISDESVSRQVRWRIGGVDVDVSSIGCFLPDDELFPRVPHRRPGDRSRPPESVLEWRVLGRARARPLARVPYTHTAAPPPPPPPP